LRRGERLGSGLGGRAGSPRLGGRGAAQGEGERSTPAPRSAPRHSPREGQLMLLLLAILRAQAEPSQALMEAAEAELARASQSLRLPNQPAPYFISYEVIDGDVATTSAVFGAIDNTTHEPYRNL